MEWEEKEGNEYSRRKKVLKREEGREKVMIK